MKHRGRAGNLLEVLVVITLLAVVLPLLLSLFPSSLKTLAHGEAVQQAVALATYRMDEAPLVCHGAGVDLSEERVLDARTYRITREYYRIDSARMDVVVQVQTAGHAPVSLQSRLIYGSER